MIPAFYIFCLMVVVGLVLYLFDLRDRKKNGDKQEEETEQKPTIEGCTDDCCSLNDVCPSEMVLAGIDRDIVYYDDEELDAFKGRATDAYTPEEEEQFRDVLYTLQPSDLLGWEQSIKKRGIILPRPIHDEFIMLYNEKRVKN